MGYWLNVFHCLKWKLGYFILECSLMRTTFFNVFRLHNVKWLIVCFFNCNLNFFTIDSKTRIVRRVEKYLTFCESRFTYFTPVRLQCYWSCLMRNWCAIHKFLSHIAGNVLEAHLLRKYFLFSAYGFVTVLIWSRPWRVSTHDIRQPTVSAIFPHIESASNRT